MKARGQRTHYMGYSNRTTSILNQNQTSDIFQKSFNKSKSQYYHTTNKVNSIGLMSGMSKDNQNNQKSYISQQNINTLYKDAEKGHHHEFESKKLRNQKNLEKLYEDIVQLAPLPLTYTAKLNSQLKELKNDYKGKEVNLHKVREMKKMFLRNNQKKRNLKEYFQQYATSQNGTVNMEGFKKLIKDCGYYLNDTQVELVFRLNKVHDGSTGGNQSQGMNLQQFVNLMTKENVYFKTLRLQDTDISLPSSYRLSPPEFQIFRNIFPKLKQALKVYKDQPITKQHFQKIMKRLDITDLVLKQHNRTQIFNQFSTSLGQLNAQQLLGLIATQQHQRISRQKQMKVSNHDGFEKNLSVNEEFLYQKKQKKDPLLDLLYPVNLKKTSFVDYERTVRSAKQICDKIKAIKEATKRDVMKELCSSGTKIKKEQLFKRVQSMLQSQGYNFSKNEYKSFLSYIDFDSTNNISSQKLENIILKEDQRQRVNRLDRRIRNQEVNQNPSEDQQQDRNPQDQFIDKIRYRSSEHWNSAKKTFIKEANVAEFKTATKFSAWPDRLYQTDFSLVQAKSNFGMGITEPHRFHKEEKHSLAQEDKLRKLRNYENKIRKVAEWQETNDRKLHERSVIEERKQLGKQYNMRLLKEQYEDRCHSKSLIQ